jgi:hypothetical protein
LLRTLRLDEPDRWSSSGYKWIAIPKFQGFCEIVCCRLRSDGRVSDTASASSLAVQARNHLANIYTPSDSSRPRSRCIPRIKTLSHSQLPADLVCFLQDPVGFKCHVGLGRPTTGEERTYHENKGERRRNSTGNMSSWSWNASTGCI